MQPSALPLPCRTEDPYTRFLEKCEKHLLSKFDKCLCRTIRVLFAFSEEQVCSTSALYLPLLRLNLLRVCLKFRKMTIRYEMVKMKLLP
jgi:hypothetical protein